MTQRWNWVEGDWDGSVLTGPVSPTPVFQASTLFPPLTLPLPPTPLCIIYGQEKGTETRKEGSRKGGAVHPLTHSQNPGGMRVGQDFGPKPQPPRNPHSRNRTPQIRDRLLLQYPSSSWGQGPHLYCVCICMCSMYEKHTRTYTHIYFMYNSLGDHPNLGSLCPKTRLELE